MPLNTPGFRFTAEQENILHAFGDSFAHVNLSSTGPGCPCMYGPPVGHGYTGAPDDPHANAGQYRQYLEGLYDVLSHRAQQANLTPRMTRNEFVDTMMREVAGVSQYFGRAAAQRRAAEAVIRRLEATNPAGNQ